MASLWSLAQTAAYNVIGADAVLTVGGEDYAIRAQDLTGRIGDLRTGSPLQVATIAPLAAIRASDLAELGFDPLDIEDSALAMGGNSYRVASVEPKPSPAGEADGEYLLMLEKL